MKIYTKRGDTGETSLFGGQKVSKDACRIESYGTVDELNSTLGAAVSMGVSPKTREIIENLQEELFILGADLATPPQSDIRIKRIQEGEVTQIERIIDELEEELPPLKNFILPGGAQGGSLLHLSRTICRRAERICVNCKKQGEQISDEAISYLNRLSDLLFVLARYENKSADIPETPWKPGKNK